MSYPERYQPAEVSDKSRLVTLILGVFLGVFGGHRFYAGRIQSGIVMACTLGGLGLWWLYDMIIILAGAFRDEEGRVISDWEIEPGHALGNRSDLMDELAALRQEVAELHERVDFTERLLADPERGVPRTPPKP